MFLPSTARNDGQWFLAFDLRHNQGKGYSSTNLEDDSDSS